MNLLRKYNQWAFIWIAVFVVAVLYFGCLRSEAVYGHYQAAAMVGLVNAAMIVAINWGTVPDVAVDFDSEGGGAVRAGYFAYVVYAASVISLLAILALCVLATLLDWFVPSFTLAGMALAAVAVYSTLISLAYVDRLVYEDFGVHIYEFDIIDVLRDGVSRKHIGVRSEDLRRIYGLIAALVGLHAALLSASYILTRWLPLSVLGIALLLLSAGTVVSYWRFRNCCRSIASNNFEFFDALPLGSHLLLEGSKRPFLSVRTKRGPTGYPDVAAAEEAPVVQRRKNIVVLLSDGLRADHVSREAGLTPNIMKFIDRNNPYVAKRHFSASHFTDQSVFGMIYGVDGYNFVPFLQERVPSYPIEALKKNGYVTAFFTHSILNKFPNNWLMDLFDESANAASDDEVIEKLDEFLERRRQDARPYIVFAFIYTPHWPYEFKETFAIDYPYEGTPRAPHEAHLATKNSYRNSVRQADAYFGKAVDLLEKDVQSGGTVLVFTSDHGTEFWEHDTIIGQGKATFWKEKVEVPLIVATQGVGRFSDMPISSHVDLMPTLLDLLEVKAVDPEAFSDGLSLYSGDDAAERQIYISGRLFPYANRSNAVVDSRSKYWFRTTGANSQGGLDFSLFRAMTLEDAALSDNLDQVPLDFAAKMQAFQARFLKYLKIVPRYG